MRWPIRTDQKIRVTELTPLDTSDEPFFYSFKVQCTSCREVHPNWVSVSRYVGPSTNVKLLQIEAKKIQESSDVSGSRGDANFVWRCKSCKVCMSLGFH